MYRSPVDIYVDEWVYDLLEAVERTGARRVLIDSLTDLQFASPDEVRFREYMYSLVQRFSRQGVSLFMTSELPDLFHVRRLSEFGVSHLSDNVVVLQYIRDESTVRRGLTVLKTRASRHEPEIREFRITPEGIVLGDDVRPRPAIRLVSPGERRRRCLLLLLDLHAHLPVRVLVNDAETLEILHGTALPGSPTTLDRSSGRASGARRSSRARSRSRKWRRPGRPQHVPELRHDSWARPRWWSASLHRARHRPLGPRRGHDRRRGHRPGSRATAARRARAAAVALQQTIAAVPRRDLAAHSPAGRRCPRLRPSGRRGDDPPARRRESRAPSRRRQRPSPQLRDVAWLSSRSRRGRLERIVEGGRHPLVETLGINSIEVRWLRGRERADRHR